MPNVSPRGVFVRPTPTTSAPMTDGWVFDGTTWRQVDKVFGGTGTGWGVVWARTATDPSAVTLTWATSQVTVAWTLPSPEAADSYAVRRPDGSLAGTVAAGVSSFVDVNPLPLNGAYTVHGVLGGVEAAGASSAALDLTMPASGFAGVVNNGGTAAPTVTFGWGFTSGRQPDQWIIRRNGVTQATLAGSTTTWTDSSPLIGASASYRIYPVLSGVESTVAFTTVLVPAAPPTGVTLTAPNPPINTLRLAWSAPSGSRTGFEVERGDGATWSAHATLTDLTSDWTTSVAGYMRVRTTSTGGNSAWVQAGPVTPVTDVTPPAEVFVADFAPDATYGRMVLFAYLPTDADLASYQVQARTNGGAVSTIVDWTAGTPGQLITPNTHTGSAGQVCEARVNVRDTTGNTRTGVWHSYTLLASPQYVNPTDGGTSRNGVWRNDSAVDANDVQTGGTSTGQNIGCYFYGDQVTTLVGNKTVTGILLYLQRRDINGNSAGIQPLWWTHNLASKSGTPTLSDEGVAEASRLSPAMTRTGASANAQWWMPSAFVSAFVLGSVKGLAAYRTGGSGSPDQFYMALQEAAVNFSGMMEIHHLG